MEPLFLVDDVHDERTTKEEEGEEDVEKKGVARIKIGRGNPYFVRPSFLVRVTEQRWITRFMGREIKG